MATASLPTAPTGWGFLPRTALRFCFLYFLLYSLVPLLAFPGSLTAFVVAQVPTADRVPDSWLSQAVKYLSYPGTWHQQGVDEITPWLCDTLLGVEVELPSPRFTGSGDRMFEYCTCFAYLVLAGSAALIWTIGSETLRLWKTHRAPNYDWLHSLFRLIVSFHLMSMMLVYGAIKVWCSQFPPITDAQLEVTYGDSSPMGLLWRFMQFSQPYTAATGIIEFACGVLLIFRRTTLLGALCAAGAALQVFMLNMCYDVPVKLMSGHLLVMALLLIAPDAKRLFALFVLGRPIAPVPDAPLFGRWKWLNRAGFILRTVFYVSFASLTLYHYYQEAKTGGILAPEKPTTGRWIATGFVRDGKEVTLASQPDESLPKKIIPSKWKSGPGMPSVAQLTVSPRGVVLLFEDGSRAGFSNASKDDSELVLFSFQDRKQAAVFRVSFPEPDVLVLEGPVGGEEIRLTLRRPRVTKEYLLKKREFQWVQEAPFNR
jgi:hypothetical protein